MPDPITDTDRITTSSTTTTSVDKAVTGKDDQLVGTASTATTAVSGGVVPTILVINFITENQDQWIPLLEAGLPFLLRTSPLKLDVRTVNDRNDVEDALSGAPETVVIFGHHVEGEAAIALGPSDKLTMANLRDRSPDGGNIRTIAFVSCEMGRFPMALPDLKSDTKNTQLSTVIAWTWGQAMAPFNATAKQGTKKDRARETLGDFPKYFIPPETADTFIGKLLQSGTASTVVGFFVPREPAAVWRTFLNRFDLLKQRKKLQPCFAFAEDRPGGKCELRSAEATSGLESLQKEFNPKPKQPNKPPPNPPLVRLELSFA